MDHRICSFKAHETSVQGSLPLSIAVYSSKRRDSTESIVVAGKSGLPEPYLVRSLQHWLKVHRNMFPGAGKDAAGSRVAVFRQDSYGGTFHAVGVFDGNQVVRTLFAVPFDDANLVSVAVFQPV